MISWLEYWASNTQILSSIPLKPIWWQQEEKPFLFSPAPHWSFIAYNGISKHYGNKHFTKSKPNGQN